MAKNKLQVMMLEDDSDDRFLTSEVVEGLAFDLQLTFYSNSTALFAALKQAKPNLIVVDYNSTPENGSNVLRKLKANYDLRSIPVIILSDSGLSKYKAECYHDGASAFVIKPTSMEETKKKIVAFFTYWSAVAES